VMLVGRLFHAHATVTRNDRWPVVLSRVRGTISSSRQTSKPMWNHNVLGGDKHIVLDRASVQRRGGLWLEWRTYTTTWTTTKAAEKLMHDELSAERQRYVDVASFVLFSCDSTHR